MPESRINTVFLSVTDRIVISYIVRFEEKEEQGRNFKPRKLPPGALIAKVCSDVFTFDDYSHCAENKNREKAASKDEKIERKVNVFSSGRSRAFFTPSGHRRERGTVMERL